MADYTVAGIGEAGINIINEIADEMLENVTLVSIDISPDDLSHSSADEKILWTTEQSLSTKNKPDLIAFLKTQGNLYDVLVEAKKSVIVYSLSDPFACDTGLVLASVAQLIGIANFQMMVISPFTFEGHRRSLKAKQNLAYLKQKISEITALESDKLLSFVDTHATLQDVHTQLDKMVKWHILSYLTN